MDLNIRWKRVLLIGVTGAIVINLIAYWVMPRFGCVDRLEDLQQLAIEHLAQGNTALVTVDTYYIEETKQWCYVEVTP